MTDFKKQIGNPKEARKGFDGTLLAYRNSGFKMFQEIADTLDNYKEQILNSFIMIERTCGNKTRLCHLSNSLMESLNRIPKELIIQRFRPTIDFGKGTSNLGYPV